MLIRSKNRLLAHEQLHLRFSCFGVGIRRRKYIESHAFNELEASTICVDHSLITQSQIRLFVGLYTVNNTHKINKYSKHTHKTVKPYRVRLASTEEP